MKSKQPKADEKKSAELLKKFLRTTGRIFPETPEQVDAFESRNHKKEKLPDLLSNPTAMLQRGFILQQAETNQTMTEPENCTFESMAARKGLKISAETLQKMKADRLKAEQDARNRNKK